MATDRDYHSRWRRNNREKCEAAQRRYRESLGPRVYNLIRNHGLSREQAEAVVAMMPTSCEICGRGAKLYFDHDHATHKHRGWLCNRCNVALAVIEDPELLSAATTYLEKAAA